MVSPSSARITILRMPLTKPANSTAPSISVMTACSFGLRASKSSATRGRPPVMSLVLVVSRGILAMMSPWKHLLPVGHEQVGAHRQHVAPARLAQRVVGVAAGHRLPARRP